MKKLKDLIPRHQFQIPIQAAIGGKIVARETIKGFKRMHLQKYMVEEHWIEKENF